MIRKFVLFCACAALSWAGKFVVTQQGETVTTPRTSAATTPLLFAFVTSQSGFDTEITLANTSLDTFGSAPQNGSCILTYFGAFAPAPQTSPTIVAGKQFVFNVSQGGGGIAAAPGFSGYIIVNCAFPLARGFAKVFAPGIAFAQDAQVLSLPRSTTKPQNLLLPFVTNQGGFDTGIAIANTSLDPFGTAPAAGACTLFFFGANAPASVTTPVIAAGSLYITLASLLAPNFQGYVVISCNFNAAAGQAFVSDLGAHNVALNEIPQLLTLPRDSTVRPLLFSSVTSQNGQDTGITLANTTADPFGTAAVSGSCTLNFFGTNAPAPSSTPIIQPGTVYTNLTSALAPNFQGYIISSCSFPLARGYAFTAPAGIKTDGDSQTAEILTLPRNGAPATLLFSDATNWNGADTNITISNTSLDPFGTAQGSGACALSYFGDTANGGGNPPPQFSSLIPPASQLSFTLSGGNPAQNIAPRPGFHGYIIASCGFPLARGLATITAAQGGPPSVTKVGTFRNGQWNLDLSGTAQYAPATDFVGNFGLPGDTPVVGDWTGSGTKKLGIYRNGVWYLDMNGNGQWDGPAVDLVGSFGGFPGDIPVVGDWTGNGKTKVGIFRKDGTWHLDTSGTAQYSPATDLTGSFGFGSDIPVVGDWNGAGKTCVGVFRAGVWHLDLSCTAQYSAATDRTGGFGSPTDIPVVGDWTGDGKTKVGIFRNGEWHLDLSGTAQYNPATDLTGRFGSPGDIPVIGDWTGSGTSKVGVYRGGVWYLDLNGNVQWDGPAVDRAGGFGVPTDVPLVGRWN